MKRFFLRTMLAVVALIVFSCKKDFLDRNPNKALLIPKTLTDLQSLLDNTDVMNKAPALQMISSDDFYTVKSFLDGATVKERNSYLWADDVYEGLFASDWDAPYQQVFYANIVLDALKEISPEAGSQADYNRVKGSALFYRAMAFYNLGQLFMRAYDGGSATADPGVPLPLVSDVNESPGRGNVQMVYDRIIADLQEAAPLLPAKPSVKSRPSQPAVYALLARVYLAMQNYPAAEEYAGRALAANDKLIDYNTLDTLAARPFPLALPDGNDEVIFYSILIPYVFNTSSMVGADTALYGSYAGGDLRRPLFFKPKVNNIAVFKGSYTGSYNLFGGLATDEMYLVRAECYARRNDISDAMNTLGSLLVKRYKGGRTGPLAPASQEEAVKMVLAERRKELVSRGTRWMDLRRLNKDPLYAVTLERIIGGVSYTLVPGDPRYVFPVPDNEIASSGIAQNVR